MYKKCKMKKNVSNKNCRVSKITLASIGLAKVVKIK
jgi:hypothetical protein